MLALAKIAVSPPVFSDLYATSAFPEGSGPDYVNAAAAIETDLPPNALLTALQGIEAAAGRTRRVRWGPRTLDLDLIGLGDNVLPDMATFTQWRDLPLARQMEEAPEGLILPHPRLQDRGFVLVPLAQIAPDWVHPVSGQSVAAMCAALDASARDEVRWMGPPDLSPENP